MARKSSPLKEKISPVESDAPVGESVSFKSILRFFFVFCILSGLLLYPWSSVEQGYRSAFRWGGDVVFSRFWFWPDGNVRFIDLKTDEVRARVNAVIPHPLPPAPKFRLPLATGELDVLMVYQNRSAVGSLGLVRTSSRNNGYWPTVFLIALILAKRMSWSRRGWSMLWGMLMVHGFIAFRLSINMLATGFAVPGKRYALFEPSGFWLTMLHKADEVFVQNPTVSFVAAAFIWLVVAFTKQDWRAIFQATRGDEDAYP